ncbi:MAG: hypothetical protein WBD21_08160 [Candidatus Acidiferrales bacterium]
MTRTVSVLTWSLLVLAFILVWPKMATSQTNKIVALTQIKVQGSEPPNISNWNGCVKSLGGKIYNESTAKECLDSILATGYFAGGRIETESYKKGRVRVVFRLDAPSLVLSELKINLPNEEKQRLVRWLSQDKATLGPGDIYTRDGEVATWFGIDNYYRSLGRHAGISETLHLNYRDKTADLSYEILEGPSMAKEGIVPPYGAPCKEYVTVNLTGVDDYVPIALIDSLTETRAFSCFDPESVQHDQNALASSGMFKKVQYSVMAPALDREVLLIASGKPLTVKEVSIQRYGEAMGTPLPSPDKLRVRVGSVYSRSDAWADTNYLKQIFAKRGETVNVFEDEEALPRDTLKVKYYVLRYESAQLFVDGKKIVQLTDNSGR